LLEQLRRDLGIRPAHVIDEAVVTKNDDLGVLIDGWFAMTGAADAVAAAVELEEAGVADGEAVGDCSGAFLVKNAGFLQPPKASAKTRERMAKRLSINAVMRFKLEQGNYKRFLVFVLFL
jgi:hypothetical protein